MPVAPPGCLPILCRRHCHVWTSWNRTLDDIRASVAGGAEPIGGDGGSASYFLGQSGPCGGGLSLGGLSHQSLLAKADGLGGGCHPTLFLVDDGPYGVAGTLVSSGDSLGLLANALGLAVVCAHHLSSLRASRYASMP